jgi:hypothetical protein
MKCTFTTDSDSDPGKYISIRLLTARTPKNLGFRHISRIPSEVTRKPSHQSFPAVGSALWYQTFPLEWEGEVVKIRLSTIPRSTLILQGAKAVCHRDLNSSPFTMTGLWMLGVNRRNLSAFKGGTQSLLLQGEDVGCKSSIFLMSHNKKTFEDTFYLLSLCLAYRRPNKCLRLDNDINSITNIAEDRFRAVILVWLGSMSGCQRHG